MDLLSVHQAKTSRKIPVVVVSPAA